MNDAAYSATPTMQSGPVRLEQLSPNQGPALATALKEDDLWRLWYTAVPQPEDVAAEIDRRLSLQQAGSMAPWAILDNHTQRPVGMTTFMNIDTQTPRLEIGHTWILRKVQRTGLNSHAKLLLLTRAFEELKCIAVEFRTHFHNFKSREAIARLGARQDGILRHNMIFSGVPRDTVVFSILRSEWPTVKLGLQERIAQGQRTAD